MKYNIGDRVKTNYGIGTIVKVKSIEYMGTTNWCYKIKYNLFTRLWCFEFSIEGKVTDES